MRLRIIKSSYYSDRKGCLQTSWTIKSVGEIIAKATYGYQSMSKEIGDLEVDINDMEKEKGTRIN